MQATIAFAILALALWPLLAGNGSSRAGAWAVAVTALLASIFFYLWAPRPTAALKEFLPAKVENERFVTSDTCRPCHPSEYASWRRTFHRTMTQPATGRSVLAPFDEVRLEHRERTYHLERKGDEFWIDMIDPTWELSQTVSDAGTQPLTSAPRMKQRVVMTTGSHHLQAYWVTAPHGNGMLLQIPWVYNIADRRWIPAADSFLKPPPQGPVEIEVWNTTCIDCHSVGGQPRMQSEKGTMFSQSAELGIACESCHGPAEEHVRLQRAPLRRYRHYWTGEKDSTIMQPERLSSRQASQICGQCHSVFGPLEPKKWMQYGKTYRAGGDLESTLRIVRYTEPPHEPWLRAWLEQNADALSGRFWADGTVRVAGREYNGLIESACYLRGNISCLSCHSMHRSDPNDQLKSGMEGNEACLPCHESYRSRLNAHTHHAPESSGSLCYNCHMPYTTYGLFVAMRSHRIDNPSVEASVATGRPNACNLCHLDRPLAWAAEYLSKWYQDPGIRMSDDEREIAAGVQWVLRGDAAQRIVTAWSMGWKSAQQISGHEWMAPFLAHLLEDPYSAVRYVAYRSLRTLPHHGDLQYDFIGSREQQARVKKQALDSWNRSRPNQSKMGGSRVLLDSQGALFQETVDRLIQLRDNRPIRIIE